MKRQEAPRMPRAICWDLENTVGRFRRVIYEMQGQAAPEWARPTTLRYGMRELLQDFSETNGFVHYITTAASTDFATESLRRTGMAALFKGIMGKGVISTGWGKHYEPVAHDLGYSHQEAQANMIVVGDASGDSPIDIEGLVFFQISNYNYDALVIREIFTSLLEAGNGNFREGFDALYQRAKPRYPDMDPEFQQRTVDLGNGISFQLKMHTFKIPGDEDGRSITVPMIEGVDAPDYIQDPVEQ